MKLVYSKSRYSQTDLVHRFDVLGDFLPSDLDVLKNSLFIFFEQLKKSGIICPVVVLDISESTIKINEAKLQLFVIEVKTHALASQVFLTVAQSDIESMHAEQKGIEQALHSQINLLENKVDLVELVKNKIQLMENENQELREKLKKLKTKKSSRSFFEKLWGES